MEKEFRIPYFITERTSEMWSPAMRDFANECIGRINKAKTREEKEKIALRFAKWIKDFPEIQF